MRAHLTNLLLHQPAPRSAREVLRCLALECRLMPASEKRPWIFISYRRSGGKHLYAWQISHELETHFGPGSVFCDCISIDSGDDWAASIRAALAGCHVLLVVVDDQWHRSFGSESENDWVYEELRTGVERRCIILPLLLDGAQPLVAAELRPPIDVIATFQCAFADTRSPRVLTAALQLVAERIKHLAQTSVTLAREASIVRAYKYLETDHWQLYIDGVVDINLDRGELAGTAHIAPGRHEMWLEWVELEPSNPRVPTYVSVGKTERQVFDFLPGKYRFVLKRHLVDRNLWQSFKDFATANDPHPRTLEQVGFEEQPRERL